MEKSLKLNPSQDALFLDLDGTLLDIAQTPNGVVVSEEIKLSLRKLYDRMGGALAIVSGRTIENIDDLLSPLRLPVAGTHGAELRTSTKGKKHHKSSPLPEKLTKIIKNIFAEYDLIRIEDKKYTIAVHYRQIPKMEKIIENILEETIKVHDGNFTLLKGKKVFEIVRAEFSKGEAVKTLMTKPPFIGRKAIYFGDDETDRSAIKACRDMGGIGLLVANDKDFSSPADVRKWLKKQINSL